MKIVQMIRRLVEYVRHSLQVRLGVMFVLAFMGSAIFVAVIIFYDHYRQSHRLQDEVLVQIATHINPKESAVMTRDLDNDARIYVQTSAGGVVYEMLGDIGKLPVGFSTLGHGDDSHRVFVLEKSAGRVAVMQENEYRADFAVRAALSGVLPLLLWLFPLLSILTFVIIRNNLSPIKRLSDGLAHRQLQDFSPLETWGVPSEFVGFVRAINGLLARVNAAMSQQQRFIADAAHELRSPMTALSIQVQRLSALPMSDQMREQTDEILTIISRNRHLLEQLLCMAKVQAEESATHTTIQVQSLMGSVVGVMYPLALYKDIDLGVVSECHDEIIADEASLFILLKIFVENAIAYTPKGGRVDVGAGVQAGVLSFVIEDSGMGIADCDKQRVFDPFYRVLGTGVEGTGLGLSIANAIAKRYDGRIELSDSTVSSSGLRVCVTFELNKLQGVSAL